MEIFIWRAARTPASIATSAQIMEAQRK